MARRSRKTIRKRPARTARPKIPKLRVVTLDELKRLPKRLQTPQEKAESQRTRARLVYAVIQAQQEHHQFIDTISAPRRHMVAEARGTAHNKRTEGAPLTAEIAKAFADKYRGSVTEGKRPRTLSDYAKRLEEDYPGVHVSGKYLNRVVKSVTGRSLLVR